jgi:WD40 repeat protein
LFDLRQGASLGSVPGLGLSTHIRGFSANWLGRWDGSNHILVDKCTGSQYARLGSVTLDSGTQPITALFNAARQLVAWNDSASSNSVFLATFSKPERRIELKSEIAGLSPYLFSDDGKYLATLSPDGAAFCVWNPESGQRLVTVNEPIADVAFALGGRVMIALVFVTPDDNEIRFYDLDHPDRDPRRISGKHEPSALAISPDGRLVAASTQAGIVRLCDAVTGELIADLPGNGRGVAFSKDGRRVISAGTGRDGIKLLDIATRQELLNLSGTGPVLQDASWSADGDTIICGSRQSVWLAWHAPSWEEITAAEAKEKAKAQPP